MSPADAIAIRQARRARVRTIRRRVIAGAVALFVATWLLITLMLVTGHDPALARQTSTASTATAGSGTSVATTKTSGAATSATTSSTKSASGTSTNSSSASTGSGSSAVTTSQS
jgi:hypothetical protein